jgi:hypothetical protein
LALDSEALVVMCISKAGAIDHERRRRERGEMIRRIFDLLAVI